MTPRPLQLQAPSIGVPKQGPMRRTRHPLITEAGLHFAETRSQGYLDGFYLRPMKRKVLDLLVSKESLDAGLKRANLLFQTLDARGHRVSPGVGGHPVRSGRFWRPGRQHSAPRCPLRASTRSPSPDARRSLSRCAAATIPVAPAPRSVVSSRRSKRWPSRRGTTVPSASSTSRSLLLLVAGFQPSISGRFWVSTEGRRASRSRARLGEHRRRRRCT